MGQFKDIIIKNLHLLTSLLICKQRDHTIALLRYIGSQGTPERLQLEPTFTNHQMAHIGCHETHNVMA